MTTLLTPAWTRSMSAKVAQVEVQRPSWSMIMSSVLLAKGVSSSGDEKEENKLVEFPFVLELAGDEWSVVMLKPRPARRSGEDRL